MKAQVDYFLPWLVTMNNSSEHIAMTVSPHVALSIIHRGLHGVGQGLRPRRRQVQLLRWHGHRSRDDGRLAHHHQVHGLRQEALYRPGALRCVHG